MIWFLATCTAVGMGLILAQVLRVELVLWRGRAARRRLDGVERRPWLTRLRTAHEERVERKRRRL